MASRVDPLYIGAQFQMCAPQWLENFEGWERFTLSHPFSCLLRGPSLYILQELPHASEIRSALAHSSPLSSSISLSPYGAHFCMYLNEAAVRLQGENQAIISRYTLIEQCTTDLMTLRANVDNFSQWVFQHSYRIAKKSEIPVMMSCVSQQQRNCSNPESDSGDQY